VLVTA